MKFQTSISIALLYIQAALAVPSSLAEQECGGLGVMNVDPATLPEGVDPANVRKCLNHPEGLLQRDEEKNLFARECWYRDDFGCSKSGWCYKTCGANGQWCWAAQNGGYGSWIGCSSFRDCNKEMACGQGNCKACGCNCGDK
ncbi:hypothetical protein E4U21_005575 [Claviceps maximensis]|nr:hypothetical protein E4U21_005575 [Claviceps maximensis]